MFSYLLRITFDKSTASLLESRRIQLYKSGHQNVRTVSRCGLWNGPNVRPTDDGPLSSFQGRSSSASSFHASPPGDRWSGVLGFVPAGNVSSSSTHVNDGVMSLALCQQVMSQAPQHNDRWSDVLDCVPAGSVSSSSTLQIFREASYFWGLLCPPVYLLGHFLALRHVHGSTSTVFKGGCRHISVWVLTHISRFVASSLNVWGLSKHIKGSRERYLLGQDKTSKFSG